MYLAYKKLPPPPKDPIVGLCLGPYGGPRGEAVSYERGTPVLHRVVPCSVRECSASKRWRCQTTLLTALPSKKGEQIECPLPENGPSQGLTGLFVPFSLDSGSALQGFLTYKKARPPRTLP